MNYFAHFIVVSLLLSPVFLSQSCVAQQHADLNAGQIRPRSLLVSRDGLKTELEQRVQASATKRLPSAGRTSTTQRPVASPPATLVTTASTQKAFSGKPGCQVDIVLLVDMSGGALNKRERYLALATDLVRALDIGEFAAQVFEPLYLTCSRNPVFKVALVRYSGKGRADTVFRLKNRYNQSSLISELTNAQPLGGTTRTKEAMLHARREFERKYGGREKADKVLVVFTDGYSQDDPAEVAAELRREKIQVYAVAVEDQELGPNEDQLKAIASDTQSIIIGATQFGAVKQRVAPARCR